MKKISVLLGLALGMLTVGCGTDTTEDVVAGKGGKTVIGVSFETTRTSLGEASGTTYPVLWSEGDKVAVNGVVSEAVAAEAVGQNTAKFTVSGVEAPYNVIYPAEALDANGNIAVADVQTWKEGSFAEGSAIMLGSSESTDVLLKSVYGFVKIPIARGADNKTVKSVTISANALEALSGVFTADFAECKLNTLSGNSNIKVVGAEGTIPYNAEGKADVIVALPAGEYANGFTVVVADTEGGYMKKTMYATGGGATIEAGVMLAMPELQYNAEGRLVEITNSTELQNFLSAVDARNYTNFVNENGEVLLGNDIDLAGTTLTGAKSAFDGIFNGQGYALKNWKSDGVALFAELAAGAVVKNLVLDASCELTFPEPATVETNFGFIAIKSAGTVSGCENMADATLEMGDLANDVCYGIMVGFSDTGSTVANCINRGKLSFTFDGASVKSTRYFGTVIGRLNGAGSTISDCINYGDIDIEVTKDIFIAGGNNSYIGGVTGTNNDKSTVDNCRNYGNLTYKVVSAGAATVLGGVSSYGAGAVTNCQNYGDIRFECAGRFGAVANGGIIGYTSGAVNNCQNYGKVTIWGGDTGYFAARNGIGSITEANAFSTPGMAIGGIVAYMYKTTMTGDTNYGDIAVKVLVNMSTGTSGRPSVGGIVAAAWGDVKDCVNEGKISAEFLSADRKPIARGFAAYVAGISGGDYYTKDQTSSSYYNCINRGDIYYCAYNTTTNAAVGGIVAWPGVEDGPTNITSGCINYGDITIDGSNVGRYGGIHGGTGRMEKCINYGTITVTAEAGSTAVNEVVGGLAGFHSRNVNIMTDCENYGDVISESTSKYVFIGGLTGNVGNAASTSTTGCKVDCTVSTKGENTQAGMLVGYFNGKTQAVGLGSESAPLLVRGTLVRGGETTEMSAETITKEYMFSREENSDTGHELTAVEYWAE